MTDKVINTKIKDEGGFSLLEVVVAMLLTIGLMGLVFSLTGRNQQIFVTESSVVDMNQNIRTATDLLTRDIQSSGVGLPVTYGNFASIFYTDGANGAPDSILMLNGDPFSPVADVDERAAGSAEFFLFMPNDVIVTGSGSNQQFSYVDRTGSSKPIYLDYETDPYKRRYIVYDETQAMILDLTKDGQTVGNGATERINIQHNPTSYLNPPSVFGTVVGTGEPNYEKAKLAVLGSTLGYRLNTVTGELERTEDLVKWYPVARGIINFQIEYRVVLKNASDTVEEKVTNVPGDGTDATAGGTLTSRRDIRSVIITIQAETPDIPRGNKSYRQVTHKFEVAPRNLNLVNNNNLSVDQ
ncbi:MAG: hypothetical protein AB1757_00150 [Acidobacteriota bacterium]